MKPVLVDTSAFFALVDRNDRNHGAATGYLKSASARGVPLLTTTDVLDELVTLTRYRLGHSVAVTAGETLLRSKWCRLLDIGDAVREAAWQLFVRYDDQTFSFTDCTSFATMRSVGSEAAFTFDQRDFAAAGFVALPS